jgi:glycosyltransferase involved in cell wall biosynthesis
LISSYACDPTVGSEGGKGWNVIKEVSKYHDIWVLTRADRRERVEAETQLNPLPNIHWIYYDLPYWMRFWRKHSRGQQLHYYIWQIAISRVARKLHKNVNFDVVHHSTYGRYWTPSGIARVDAPFLWGPVGGGESSPYSFYSSLNRNGRILEILRNFARRIGHLDPGVRFTVRRADLIIATTQETEQQIQKLGSSNRVVAPAIALSNDVISQLGDLPIRQEEEPLRFISIGRLLGWKGFHLGLQSFAKIQKEIPNSEYWIIGDGPQRGYLEKLTIDLNIQEKVRFFGKLPRRDTLIQLAECDVKILPSFHDSGGWVCLEAMAAGRPVICLDLGGPGVLINEDVGIKIKANTPKQAIQDMGEAMLKLAKDSHLRRQMGEAGRKRIKDSFTWEARGKFLSNLYTQIATKPSQQP